MKIITVDFIYKCQVCGGLAFVGPYYFTDNSPLFNNMQKAIQMIVNGYMKKIRFDGVCEICHLDGDHPDFIFSSLMQPPAGCGNEIFKYSWHGCGSDSSNSVYNGVMGLSKLSGFKLTHDNPNNDQFLEHLMKLSEKCNNMNELISLLINEKGQKRT